jgi:predicted ATP-grasp superfamily ATP-dependent carboligase
VNEDLKIAFFTTEIDIDKTLYYKIATMTIQWALHHHCKLIISSAGAPTYKEREWTPEGYEIGLYAVSSTESGLSIMRKHEFSLLKSGTISWIPSNPIKRNTFAQF